MTSGVSTGRSSFCKCPCTRTCGAEPIDRCRSEPLRSRVAFNRSGKFITVPSTFGSRETRVTALHRFPHDFLDGGQPIADLLQPALTKGQHPLTHGELAHLDRRLTGDDELPQPFAHFHDLEDAEAALVTRAVASIAAAPAKRAECPDLRGIEPGLGELGG